MQDILNEKYDNTVFYQANLAWLEDNNNKKAYETMWIEVLVACTSTIKKFVRKVPGIYTNEDIEEFAIEGSEKVMKSIIKNKRKIDNLSNYVFLYCYGVFYSVKRQNINKRETPFIYETHDNAYNTFEDDIIRKLTLEGY
jgi:uncharacterized protein YutD